MRSSINVAAEGSSAPPAPRAHRRRTAEVAVAIHALNRMLELGRQNRVRTA
jgi:hypothetical protein